LGILPGYLPGQDSYKFEQEVRLKEEKVPEKAKTYIERFSFTRKIKWYLEQNLQEQSIEAKTKYQKRRYSIEFDTLGNLQDIEIQDKWKDLPGFVRDSISTILDRRFERWKIQKIQLQYTGNPERLLPLIRDQVPDEGITLRYELVLKAKTEGSVKQYEALFSDTGQLRRTSEILLRNSDHIEY
jgi:hypothetical protein